MIFGIEIMIVMSNFYKLVKDVQSRIPWLRTGIVVTNIKETLPPVLAFSYLGLTKEKKGGFRVELAKGDVWMKDLIDKHKPEDRPKDGCWTGRRGDISIQRRNHRRLQSRESIAPAPCCQYAA